jgi:hypothetical protein
MAASVMSMATEISVPIKDHWPRCNTVDRNVSMAEDS